jgi:hypothetical protein
MDCRNRAALRGRGNCNRLGNWFAEARRRNKVSGIVQFPDTDAFAAGLFFLPIPVILRFVNIGGAIGLILDVDPRHEITSSKQYPSNNSASVNWARTMV